MKPFFTLFLALFWTASVFADCAGEGLWIFPSGQTIKQNSMFVLTGDAESQQVILGLNKKHAIYLKSGNKKMKLQFFGLNMVLKFLHAGRPQIFCA